MKSPSKRSGIFYSRRSLIIAGAVLTLCCFLVIHFFILPSLHSKGRYLSPSEKQWLVENEPNLSVLFGSEAPPFAFHNEHSEYVGFLVDMLQEIEKESGVSFSFKNFATWKQLMEHAKTNRNFIIIGIAKTPARSSFLSFTEPFIKIPYVIVTRRGTNQNTLTDFASTGVCTVANYAINDFLKQHYPQIPLTPYPDNLEGLRAVSAGQCDAMVINQAYASYIIEAQGFTNLRIADESGYLNRLSAAISVNDPVLYSILDKTIDNISTTRTTQLYRKWVFGSQNNFWKSISISTLIALLFTCTVLWSWTTTLRRRVKRQTSIIKKDTAVIESTKAALSEIEDHFTSAFEQPSVGMFQLNDTLHFTRANKTTHDLLGYAPKELLETRFTTVCFDADRKLMEFTFDQLLQQETQSFTKEMHFLKKDGTGIWTVLTLSFYHPSTSPQPFILGTLHNIHKHKMMEQELLKAKKEMQRFTSSKATFLANFSHEIRTPLNGILGILQILQQANGDTTDNSSLASEALASGQHLLKILQDTMELSRIESGKATIEPVAFSISALLNHVQHVSSHCIRDKELTIEFTNESNQLDTLLGDKHKVEQILLNLVSNAIKFTSEGIVNISVTKSVHPDNPEEVTAIFTVSDTGIGISPEQQKKVFEPFHQLQSSRHMSAGGVGLGLPIVKQLVGLLKGTIALTSTVGKGTTVEVTLPFEMATSAPEVSPEVTAAPPSPIHNIGKNKIALVAEDEPVNQLIIERFLEEMGFTVKNATSGKEALEILGEQQVDIILMDIQMPLLDGVQATSLIRTSHVYRAHANIPIIAVTAHALRGDREKYLALGFNEYIAKPIEKDNLLHTISRVLL